MCLGPGTLGVPYLILATTLRTSDCYQLSFSWKLINTNSESWIQTHTVETAVLTILWRNEDNCHSSFLGAGKQGVGGFFFFFFWLRVQDQARQLSSCPLSAQNSLIKIGSQTSIRSHSHAGTWPTSILPPFLCRTLLYGLSINVSWINYSTVKKWGETFLMVQWLRIHLLMQGTPVQSLIWKDPTCRGPVKPLHRNYWAQMPRNPCSATRETTEMRSPHTAVKSSPHPAICHN